MSEERRKILEMLAGGTITADEAEQLLAALGEERSEAATTASSETEGGTDEKPGRRPKYLYVQVKSLNGEHHGGRENVNVKIPLMLLKAGIKMGSLIPDKARGKLSEHLSSHGVDIDLKDLDAEKLNVLVEALQESSIEVDSDKEKVRIYCG